MDLTNYLQSGYGGVFVETNEVKRAVNTIRVNSGLNKVIWNCVQGIVKDFTNPAKNIMSDQNDILDKAKEMHQTIVVLENYDLFLNDAVIVQTFLNNYPFYKANQVCLVIVGTDRNKIPILMKELVPVLDFNLPGNEEITEIANKISKYSKAGLDAAYKDKRISEEDYKKADFSVTNKIVETCKALTVEEIENVLAYSARTNLKFDRNTILERKRDMLRKTGFMDYFEPQPIEALGGLDIFKEFIERRKEPFDNPKSIKPKMKSILLVGIQGAGKSLAGKVLSSIFNWPGIIFDVGAVKGEYVGQTGKNMRTATKIIDAIGCAIVVMDEMEKAFEQTEFGGGKQSGGGPIADMIGHFLTWSQERTSPAILLATCNKINALPPEFKRARRWDRIFFVDLPNPDEISKIIGIKNKQYKSTIPDSKEFCLRLYNEGWSGAEIEQLAIDLHYDDLETAMGQIPVLYKHNKDEIDRIREEGKKFTRANAVYNETEKFIAVVKNNSKKQDRNVQFN
jgi:ATP-dependent 26S proteasome regulatory subunit